MFFYFLRYELGIIIKKNNSKQQTFSTKQDHLATFLIFTKNNYILVFYETSLYTPQMYLKRIQIIKNQLEKIREENISKG